MIGSTSGSALNSSIGIQGSKIVSEIQKEYKSVKERKELIDFLGLSAVDDEYLSTPMEPELAARLLDAKAKHRTEKKSESWEDKQYSQKDVLEVLYHACKENIQRIDCKAVSVEEFRQKFDRTNTPCIITGCVDNFWNHEANWTWKAVYNKYKEVPMKVAEDDEENKIKIKIKEYYKYILEQRDDSPLYLFQSGFNELEGTENIIKDYRVPKYFQEDFFNLMNEDKRPPYRWFLIGPKRSGTTLHIDPLMTSAWNTSLNGHKLWVMFPWECPKWVLNGVGEDNEGIDYFWLHLPRILKKEGPVEGMITCIQRPGETIFVPGGWWHAVLNLDDTMAVTQNFCNEANFERVWRSIRIQRPQLARYFLHKLKLKMVSFYRKAMMLNKQDKFIPVQERITGNHLLDVSTDSNSDSSSSSSTSSEKSLTDSEQSDSDVEDGKTLQKQTSKTEKILEDCVQLGASLSEIPQQMVQEKLPNKADASLDSTSHSS